jgi:hypothetical protein
MNEYSTVSGEIVETLEVFIFAEECECKLQSRERLVHADIALETQSDTYISNKENSMLNI